MAEYPLEFERDADYPREQEPRGLHSRPLHEMDPLLHDPMFRDNRLARVSRGGLGALPLSEDRVFAAAGLKLDTDTRQSPKWPNGLGSGCDLGPTKPGEAIRFDEFHSHDNITQHNTNTNTITYTNTPTDTWRHNATQPNTTPGWPAWAWLALLCCWLALVVSACFASCLPL